MKTLVMGASGATGKLVVAELMRRNKEVRALLRSTATYPNEWNELEKPEIITGSIHDLSRERVSELIADCDTVISCLGHNLTLRGMFGKPRALVFDSVKKVFEAASRSDKALRFILMSTTAYTNEKNGERGAKAERLILSLLRLLLPPHADNMAAAEYLMGRKYDAPKVEWVAVRPDTLVDAPETSPFMAVDAIRRSPVFDPGTTSRINAARFMCDLATDDATWKKWLYKTPAVYNQD